MCPQPSPWVDVPATQAVVEYPRAYFERVELHPLSICLSFVQTVPLESRFTIGRYPSWSTDAAN